jgi:hypothetical protein
MRRPNAAQAFCYLLPFRFFNHGAISILSGASQGDLQGDTHMTGKAAENKGKWTILIYLSTDNSLSEEGIYALKELKKVANEKVNIFVQFDPIGRGNKARRFNIRSPHPTGKLDVEVDGVADLGEVDMSDPETLRRFIVAGVREFKDVTSHFMLILAGHGSGINEGFFLKDEERRLSEIPSSFPIMDLKEKVFDDDEVIRELGGKKIDILGFDACMMSMIEVCDEIHDSDQLDLVIGSEGFSLNAGWPYDKIVDVIKAKADIDPLSLAELIAEEHSIFYSDYHIGGLSTDLSVISLSGISGLKVKIEELAVALLRQFDTKAEEGDPDESEVAPEKPRPFYKLEGRPFQDAIILAHWAAQSYNGEQSVDLHDFCLLLQKRAHSFEGKDYKTNEQSIYKHCERVMSEIDKVVKVTRDDGAAFQFSRGISISFPWSNVNTPPNYTKLRFSRECPRWFEFVNKYVEATQRLPQNRPSARLRSTPPYSRGPEGRILSMRNPPSEFVERN